jgi:hypothetical protein
VRREEGGEERGGEESGGEERGGEEEGVRVSGIEGKGKVRRRRYARFMKVTPHCRIHSTHCSEHRAVKQYDDADNM